MSWFPVEQSAPLYDGAGNTVVRENELVLNVKSPKYGAKGDGITDDTLAIQAAINDAQAINAGSASTGGATVYIPRSSANYMTSNLVMNNTGTAYLTWVQEGIIQPIAGTVGYHLTMSGRYYNLHGMKLFGTGYWNTVTQIAALGGIQMNHPTFVFADDNCSVIGYAGVGIAAGAVWDSNMHWHIMACGTSPDDVNYTYALWLQAGPAGDQTNATMWNVHLEHCPLMLRVSDGSRWNHFSPNSKFEMSTRLPTLSTKSPVWLEDCIEISFTDTMFTDNRPNPTVWMIRADAADGAYETTNNVRRQYNFNGCQFFGSVSAGASFLAFYGSNAKFLAPIFNRANGLQAIMTLLMHNWIEDATFTLIDSNVRIFNFLGPYNKVRNTEVQGVAGATAGSVFNFNGGTLNQVDDTRLLGASFTNVVNPATVVLQDNVVRNTVTANRAFVNNAATQSAFWLDLAIFTYTAAVNLTYFSLGYWSQEIKLISTNGNVTLIHDVTKMVLIGGASRVLAPNTACHLKFGSDNVWYEV